MQSSHKYPAVPSFESLGLQNPKTEGKRLSGAELPKMGKFRFQLLAEWIAAMFEPCRVADVGGGKGLLSFFLRRHGFEAVVIDPVLQGLPEKIKDLNTDQQLRLEFEPKLPHLDQPFTSALARDFDLMVALHAHGSNIHIINAAAEYGKQFVLLPCCVIDEPLVPPQSANWFMWLADLSKDRGLDLGYFHVNFSGQNMGMYNKGTFSK